MDKTHLTCNQAMVLLDIYRGTFSRERHLGTVDEDVDKLYRHGLVTLSVDRKARMLTAGEERVKGMLG